MYLPALKLLRWTLLHNPRVWSIPTAIYEHLMNARGGYKAYELAQATRHDDKAQKIQKSIRLI